MAVRVVPPTGAGLAEAAAAVRAGKIIAYPTETVYGLGVSPFDSAALDRLFKCKGRDAAKAILLIIADTSQLASVAGTVHENAIRCMERFWPGPLSLLLPRAKGLSLIVTGGSDKVCVRCPGHDVARALCRLAGPLTSTSANAAGAPPALSVDDIHVNDIELGIDGGRLLPSPPSTIYDPESGEILREGVISRNEILKALQA